LQRIGSALWARSKRDFDNLPPPIYREKAIAMHRASSIRLTEKCIIFTAIFIYHKQSVYTVKLCQIESASDLSSAFPHWTIFVWK